MSEEPPGNWELQRSLGKINTDLKEGLAQINARLDSMVSTSVYASEQRRIDERIQILNEDIMEEKAQRTKDTSDMIAQVDRMVGFIRWLAAGIALPIALFLASIYLSQGSGAA